jgi:hypothetical protein
MKGIHLSFTIFLDILAIYYTTLELATYLEEALGNTRYHHQDHNIPSTRFMSVLLDHVSSIKMTGFHLSFKIYLESLPINYSTLDFATCLEEALGITGYHHQDHGIPSSRFMSVLLDPGSRLNERGASIFISFPASLAIHCTTLELATYLEEALGITKYHQQDHGIPSTRFMSVLLDHGSRIKN